MVSAGSDQDIIPTRFDRILRSLTSEYVIECNRIYEEEGGWIIIERAPRVIMNKAQELQMNIINSKDVTNEIKIAIIDRFEQCLIEATNTFSLGWLVGGSAKTRSKIISRIKTVFDCVRLLNETGFGCECNKQL